MISPVLARSLSAISAVVIPCLAVLVVLGHWLLVPAATALLGCSIGLSVGAARYLRRHRELEGSRW